MGFCSSKRRAPGCQSLGQPCQAQQDLPKLGLVIFESKFRCCFNLD